MRHTTFIIGAMAFIALVVITTGESVEASLVRDDSSCDYACFVKYGDKSPRAPDYWMFRQCLAQCGDSDQMAQSHPQPQTHKLNHAVSTKPQCWNAYQAAITECPYNDSACYQSAYNAYMMCSQTVKAMSSAHKLKSRLDHDVCIKQCYGIQKDEDAECADGDTACFQNANDNCRLCVEECPF